MTNFSSGNGFESGSAPTMLVNPAVEDDIAVFAPAAGRSRNRRVRATVPQQTPTVSLVIPVRNEARNIGWVLEQIADDVHEIILVDGYSSDATLITARRYRPDIKVVPQDGAGKGCALRTGFLAASGDIIVMMDADGSMAPQEIRHYLHFLTNGYDFVKGSRFIGGGGSLDITRLRRLGNRFLLGVFNSLDDADLTEPEMTVRAMQAGLRIAEVPSLELPRRSGKSNLHAIRDGSRVLRTVLRGRRAHGLSGHLALALSNRRGFEGPAQTATSAISQ